MPPDRFSVTPALAAPEQPALDETRSPWLTPIEAALYLRVALGTLRNWTSARYVPFSKRGRVVRYDRRALDRWLNRSACQGRTTMADVR